MADADYRIEIMRDDDVARSELAALFVRSFGNQTLNEHVLKWQYSDNPTGPAIAYNAYHGADLAAHYAVIPVSSILHGIPAIGLLSINTATDPAHQKRGLFVKLAEATYDEGARRGYDYVIGAANESSAPGFIRKLGFQNVGELSRRVIAGPLCWLNKTSHIDYESNWSQEQLLWRMSSPNRNLRQDYKISGSTCHTQIIGKTGRFTAIAADLPNNVVPSLERAGMSWAPKLFLGCDPLIDWKRTPNIGLPDLFKLPKLTLIFRDLQSDRTIDLAGSRFYPFDFDAY